MVTDSYNESMNLFTTAHQLRRSHEKSLVLREEVDQERNKCYLWSPSYNPLDQMH